MVIQTKWRRMVATEPLLQVLQQLVGIQSYVDNTGIISRETVLNVFELSNAWVSQSTKT